MASVRIAVLTLIAAQLVIAPASASADDIEFGRASILIERANEGLSKLADAKGAKLSDEWTGDLQTKAAELCDLVQAKLKAEKLDDSEMSLCSVE